MRINKAGLRHLLDCEDYEVSSLIRHGEIPPGEEGFSEYTEPNEEDYEDPMEEDFWDPADIAECFSRRFDRELTYRDRRSAFDVTVSDRESRRRARREYRRPCRN